MQSRIPTYIFSLFIPLALVIGCFGFYNRWLLDPQSDRNKKRASSSRAPKENAS